MNTSTSSSTRRKRLPAISDRTYWDAIEAWAVRYSDGCSWVADIYLPACWEHDYHYRFGRTLYGCRISRSAADRRFREVVQALSPVGRLSLVSWGRWAALRLAGWVAWNGHRRREQR